MEKCREGDVVKFGREIKPTESKRRILGMAGIQGEDPSPEKRGRITYPMRFPYSVHTFRRYEDAGPPSSAEALLKIPL